jgi:uncharacterized membrane protein
VDALSAVFRWFHILAGIIWIGMLYFFNWVNGAFAATLDAETKKKVVPELMPRALFWFRWGAAWTWVTGFVLLLLVFYHGGLMFDGDGRWTGGAIAMVVATFLVTFVYDALHKTFGKDPKVFGTIAFVGAAIMIVLMVKVGGFSYRAFNIHLGAMFGSMMAFNVWYRIWPAQQKIINAIKGGTPPEAALVALAGSRSKHNTYMSLPLLWAMINQHTSAFSGGNFGIPAEYSFVVLLAVILLGWHVIFRFYKLSGKVKGF